MANITHKKVIYLDTFTSDFNTSDINGLAGGVYVDSIEWGSPTTVGHKCEVRTRDSGGPFVIKEFCPKQGETYTKYFDGKFFANLHITAGAVESGTVTIIIL